MIARMLAGVAPAGRPTFLKIVYHGPKAMEELVRYDPHLVVGILGGSAGTTRDAFQLLADAQKYGAKVALYGRKINQAENQLAFIQFLRLIVDGAIEPSEAVRAYHAVLGKLGLRPHRPLEEDLKLQAMASMSYGGRAVVSVPERPAPAAAKKDCGCGCGGHGPKPAAVEAKPAGCGCSGEKARPGGRVIAATVVTTSAAKPELAAVGDRPDFARMDVGERLAYHRRRLGLGL